MGNFKILMIMLVFILAGTSCQYKEMADAEYPDQVIYMPAAKKGIYDVAPPPSTYEDPTTGGPYSYFVDSKDKRIIIPLGVYRAGVSRKGEILVKITLNTDTVAKLIDSGDLPDITEILPPEKYSLPENVSVLNNTDHSTFNLSVDFDFLSNNRDRKFALGIEISSPQRAVNPDLSTTIVFIDPDVIFK